MKTIKNFLILFSVICGLQLHAQDEQQMKYLFEGGKVHVSGFGGPIMEFSSVGNDFAFLMGGGGGILLNHTLLLGGYGEGLTTNHYVDISNYMTDYGQNKYSFTGQVNFGHGGFWIGYVNKANSPVHFAVTSKLGWGSISLYDTYDKSMYYSGDEFTDEVFVIQPQIEADLNFTKWMKMNIGVGYRFVTGVDKKYHSSDGYKQIYDSKDFNKPELTLSLLFGNFK